MAPRVVFSNLPFGPNSLAIWDQAFADVGNLATMPCVATPINAPNSFILTPVAAAFAPALVSYANFYGFYTFVAITTSTGAVTANVGGLGLLNVYLANGTTQASIGDIVVNGFYGLSYSAALNAGSGGFYLISTGGGQSNLSGDISVNGGVVTISPNAVTYAKIQLASKGSVFLANPTGGSANYQEVTTGPTLTFVGTTVQTAPLTGDVTTAANSFATAIAPGAVTAAQMGAIPARTVLGNDTAGTTSPAALTSSQLTGLVDLFGPVLPGAVPASGGGVTKFLRADSTWAATGAMVLLNTIPATVPLASLHDITSFSVAFRDYFFIYENMLPVVNNTALLMEVSTDSGVTWQNATYQTVDSAVSAVSSGQSASPSSFQLSGGASNLAGYGISGSGTFYGLPLNNIRKNYSGRTSGRHATVAIIDWYTAGYWDGSNLTITGLRWRFANVDVSGNSIASGTVKVYGIV